MRTTELTLGRSWLIRLEPDSPLWLGILEAASALGVRAAQVNVLGAVQNAAVRSFDQDAKTFNDFDIDSPLELLSGVGNISIRDGAPFLHLHVALSDDKGVAYGGHLHEEKPTRVWVAEVWLQELLGEPPVRLFDERCGLAVWQ